MELEWCKFKRSRNLPSRVTNVILSVIGTNTKGSVKMERRDAMKTAAAGVMVLSARYALAAELQAAVLSTKVI